MSAINESQAGYPAPEVDLINRTYWDGVKEGKLLYQSCTCGHNWLPPRALCPQCLGTEWQWKAAGGQAELISWVVYHVAYHPAFKDKVPYNVAIVVLEEGPRLMTNILDDSDHLSIGAKVSLSVDTTLAVPLAQFQLVKKV